MFIGNNKIDFQITQSSFDGEKAVEISASRGMMLYTGIDSTNHFEDISE